MPPGIAQEEMEEVHADLRKRDDQVTIVNNVLSRQSRSPVNKVSSCILSLWSK